MEPVTPSSTSPARGSRSTSRAGTSRLAASRTATVRATSPRAAGARSLAHQLERDRLEQRALRVRQVIHALRERAEARDTAGGAPRPLRAAIEDFGRELADLEGRLRHQGASGAIRS